MRVVCDYCKKSAEIVTGDVLYPHRADLHKLYFYTCPPCGAYVGCHPGTTKPLGRLANAELRVWKGKAHAAFDPIWKKRFFDKKRIDPDYKKGMARGGRYKKLAELLGIPKDNCHIGMFDVDMCKRVIEVCNAGLLND